MNRARPILSLAIALLIALTAQGAAVARGMPAPSGQMELCTGTGPVMVYVNAEGEPIAAPHLCPEFALSLVLALAAPAAAVTPTGLWMAQVQYVADDAYLAIERNTANARAPPV